VIDTATNKVAATFLLAGNGAGDPEGVAVAPDGNHAYVGYDYSVLSR
jgi:DNA-binding beta-propeller fold protein YncE